MKQKALLQSIGIFKVIGSGNDISSKRNMEEAIADTLRRAEFLSAGNVYLRRVCLEMASHSNPNDNNGKSPEEIADSLYRYFYNRLTLWGKILLFFKKF